MSNNYLITSSVKGSYEFSSMIVLLFYGSNKLFIKAVFKGGGGSAPPKNFLIFLKNEGKEVEKMKRDGWGVNC